MQRRTTTILIAGVGLALAGLTLVCSREAAIAGAQHPREPEPVARALLTWRYMTMGCAALLCGVGGFFVLAAALGRIMDAARTGQDGGGDGR